MDYNKLIFQGKSPENSKKQDKINNYIGQINENSNGIPLIHQQQNQIKNSQQTNLNTSEEEDDTQIKIHYLSTKFKELNAQLEAYGFQTLGDPLQPNPHNLQKTFEVVTSMLQQRSQDQELRQHYFDFKQQQSKKEQEYYKEIKSWRQSYEKIQEQNAKITQKYKILKEDTDRKIEEKELEIKEVKTNYTQILNREAQFLSDLKKKDLQVKHAQEQIKKLQDKNTQIKNNSFIQSQVNQQQQKVKEADFSEFQQLIGQKYQEIQGQLLKENETLRQGLKLVHQELNEMLVIRKKIYLRRKKLQLGGNDVENQFDEEDLLDYNLIPFRKELFDMPMSKNGDQAIQILQENVNRFRNFMSKLDDLQNEMEMDNEPTQEELEQLDKIKSIKNLKGLLQNYKKVVETQDGLLQMAIEKQEDFQNNAINQNNLENSSLKFSKLMDDEQLEKTRQYLCEQKKFLEERDQEILKSREMLEITKSKIEHEKQQILARKQEAELEVEQFKDNVLNLVDQNIKENQSYNSNVLQQIQQQENNQFLQSQQNLQQKSQTEVYQDKIEIETQENINLNYNSINNNIQQTKEQNINNNYSEVQSNQNTNNI